MDSKKLLRWHTRDAMGKIITDNLPHPPHSSFEVNDKGEGKFEIPLWLGGPGDYPGYDELAIGQRVEAYYKGQQDPVFIGLISKLPGSPPEFDNRLRGIAAL